MTAVPAPAEILSGGGTLLARVHTGGGNPPTSSVTLKRYTCYCKAPGDGRGEFSEEIDVDARTPALARRCAALELATGYEPGMRISRTVERFGLYF